MSRNPTTTSPISTTETDATASSTMPVAAAKDGIDLLLANARAMDPAARDNFLGAMPKRYLLGALDRLTGKKTSGRISPERAIARIQEALAPVASAAPAIPAESPAKQ